MKHFECIRMKHCGGNCISWKILAFHPDLEWFCFFKILTFLAEWKIRFPTSSDHRLRELQYLWPISLRVLKNKRAARGLSSHLLSLNSPIITIYSMTPWDQIPVRRPLHTMAALIYSIVMKYSSFPLSSVPLPPPQLWLTVEHAHWCKMRCSFWGWVSSLHSLGSTPP